MIENTTRLRRWVQVGARRARGDPAMTREEKVMEQDSENVPERRGEQGFTLIEALIAMVILIVGIAAISNLMVVAGSSNAVANHTTAASAIAAQQMELLKSQTFGNLMQGGTSSCLPFTRRTPGLRPGVGGAVELQLRCRGDGRRHRPRAVADHARLARGGPVADRASSRWWRGRWPPPSACAAGRLHDLQDEQLTWTAREKRGGTPMDETRTESGFSLIELLVAMLVTMIVSGAIFTLLNAGQGAFRREPELTDRQQNIRLAMDMIQRDIATAGAGMDPFEQSFSAGDAPGEGGAQLDGMSGTHGRLRGSQRPSPRRPRGQGRGWLVRRCTGRGPWPPPSRPRSTCPPASPACRSRRRPLRRWVW